MASPEERQRHMRRRQRNFIAKMVKTDKRFRQKTMEDRRHKALSKAWELKDGDIILNEDD